MTRPVIPGRIPRAGCAPYQAALLLIAVGPKYATELLALVHFGAKPGNAKANLAHSIREGWLRRLPNDRIDVSDATRKYLAAHPGVEVYSEPVDPGTLVEPSRTNMMNRPAWKPSKRLPRDDEPAWADRATPNFYRG